MPWSIRLVTLDERGLLRDGDGKTGDAFYDPDWLTLKDADDSSVLAPEYFANNARRLPIVVILPGRVHWCVDGRTIRNSKRGPSGWLVTGDLPNITVSPSIDIGGGYHGFIQNGVIGDDVTGKKFA